MQLQLTSSHSHVSCISTHYQYTMYDEQVLVHLIIDIMYDKQVLVHLIIDIIYDKEVLSNILKMTLNKEYT